MTDDRDDFDEIEEEEGQSKWKSIFLSKQFFMAIGLCAVLVVAGIYYSNSLSEIKKITSDPPVIPSVTTKPSVSSPIFNYVVPQTNAPETQKSASITPAAQDATTKPPEKAVNNTPEKETVPLKPVFSLPLSTDMGRDYSQGEMVFNSTLADWRAHNGIDFKGVIGDTVKAVSAGKVIAVYDDAIWGTVVEIDHHNGVVGKYCGLGKGSTLEVDTAVKINDTVGNLGIVPCEASESSHLHFEMTVNGAPADPLEILGRN